MRVHKETYSHILIWWVLIANLLHSQIVTEWSVEWSLTLFYGHLAVSFNRLCKERIIEPTTIASVWGECVCRVHWRIPADHNWTLFQIWSVWCFCECSRSVYVHASGEHILPEAKSEAFINESTGRADILRSHCYYLVPVCNEPFGGQADWGGQRSCE